MTARAHPASVLSRASGAEPILSVLAARSRPRAAPVPATVPGARAGRYTVDAGILSAAVTRLPVDALSGRWRFRVQFSHAARPGQVIYEEVRLGEHDARDGTVDAALARHGWWTLDDLADAAGCQTNSAGELLDEISGTTWSPSMAWRATSRCGTPHAASPRACPPRSATASRVPPTATRTATATRFSDVPPSPDPPEVPPGPATRRDG